MIITENIGTLTDGDIIAGANKRLSTLWKKRYGRILAGAALAGTAGAAADSAVEISEDTVSLAKVWNITNNDTLGLDYINPMEAFIPAKHKLTIQCIDDFSGNNLLFLSILEQQAGQTLMGKVQGHTTNLFENLGTMTLNEGNGMQKTLELSIHEVDEMNDRFVTHATLLGSTALLDSQVQFTVDGDFKGSLHNCVSVVKALKRDSWLPANIYIPKGSSFDIACIDAFAVDASIGLRICNLIETPRAAQIEAAKPDSL